MEKFGEIYNKIDTEADNGDLGKLPDEDSKKESKEKMTKEEFERQFLERKQELQRLIDAHKRLFASFAEDNSLNFMLSDGFYFLPEKGEVHIDTKWFFEEGYIKEQIIWACFHELGHFRDMVQNPEEYLENFAYIREQAKKTGKVLEKKWREKYEQNDPKFIEQITKQKPIDPKDSSKGTMSLIEQSAYGMHHRFFNVLDDIYVNEDVRRRAPRYKKGSEGDREVVRKLYKEKLFVGNDYSKDSRNTQLINTLLRSEMIDDESIIISEEIQQILDEELMYRGHKYTIKSLIDEKLKPQKGVDTNPAERYKLIKRLIEPIFIELLMKDIEEMEVQKPKKQKGKGGGEGQQGGQPDMGEIGEGENSEENNEGEGEGGGEGDITPEDLDMFSGECPQSKNPDQFKPEDIEEFLKKAKKKKDEDERQKNMTSEERAEEERKKAQREWDEEHNITEKERNTFDEIVQKINPYLDDLVELWKSIAYGKGRSFKVVKTKWHKKGSLDVGRVIDQMPNIKNATQEGTLDKLRLKTKNELREKIENKPELIKVRFVGDLSGSMDDEKRRVLKETMTLVLLSLKEFNEQLDLTRKNTQTKMRVDTEAWVYGSTFKRIKEAHRDYGEEQSNIIKAVSACEEGLGSTRDDLVLGAINEDINPQEQKNIVNKKTMELVFVVTDGVPDYEEKTRKEIDKLVDSKVVVRGFQIGDTSKSDQEIFNSVWNDGRQQNLGEIVGTDIAQLPIIIANTLKEYLGNVKV